VSPWKVILATMVIFGCGVIMGGLLVKNVIPSTVNPPAETLHLPAATNTSPPLAQIQRLEFLHRMQKQLDLDPGQREEIARIMKDSQERSRALWDTIAPQMHEELRRVRKEISHVLSPVQLKKMNELLKAHPHKTDPGSTNNRPLRPLPDVTNQSDSPSTN